MDRERPPEGKRRPATDGRTGGRGEAEQGWRPGQGRAGRGREEGGGGREGRVPRGKGGGRRVVVVAVGPHNNTAGDDDVTGQARQPGTTDTLGHPTHYPPFIAHSTYIMILLHSHYGDHTTPYRAKEGRRGKGEKGGVSTLE